MKLGLSLEGKSRLEVFKNQILKTTFRHKTKEVTGGWTRLYNEELHNL
jgi:hypothetical protein